VKVRILGCGTSSGVPRIGPDWGSCDPAEPRNRRRRQSILIEHEGTRVLVDSGPDLREQLIDAGIDRVDAVLWTHDHADHTAGIDDLRQLNRNAPIPGFAFQPTAAVLQQRFAYIFRGGQGYPAVCALGELGPDLTIGSLRIRTAAQPHGAVSSAGLRFEDGRASIGYATDFKGLTPEMRTLYQGVDLWIVDTLRRWPHPTHPCLDDVVGWHSELAIGRTLTVHMDHSMDYASLLAELPDGIEPGYDGLEVDTDGW
jgi:phosphoribosyl 1,2-cyclic phosphate phosphodiesterase